MKNLNIIYSYTILFCSYFSSILFIYMYITHCGFSLTTQTINELAKQIFISVSFMILTHTHSLTPVMTDSLICPVHVSPVLKQKNCKCTGCACVNLLELSQILGVKSLHLGAEWSPVFGSL